MTSKTRPAHDPAICVIKPGDQHFSGSMAKHCGQWVAKLTCPDCGRQMRMANNYLGDGKLVCTGERFLRPHEQTMGKMGKEKFRELLRRYP
jgi:hypothetical protein